MLINHYGLDVSNPETHEFLFDNMNAFFYGEADGVATIDTSKQGSVKW
jgi:Fe-S cluster biosynthesis and repair protein YggX